MSAEAREAVHHDLPPGAKMFGLVTGYWQSQAIGAAARLGLADELAAGAKSALEVAAARGTEPAATARLLRVLAAIGLVAQPQPDTFRLTQLGETLRSNVPGSMRGFAIAQTTPGHWLPWGRIDEAIRTGRRATPAALGSEIWEYYASHPEEGVSFSEAMSGMSAMVAGELARSGLVPPGGVVVDVGGAHGLVLSTLLETDQSLTGILYELPGVIASARAEIEARGLAERCELLGGDFFESVPAGDVYVLKNILHDWDDAQCVRVLTHCRQQMRPGGRAIIVEMVLPQGDALTPARLMDLNMLVMLPGRERGEAEYSALFSAAGLRLNVVRQTHSPYSLIEARAAA